MEAPEYDTMAQIEDRYWWYRNLRRRVASALRAEVAGAPPRRILDVGCGTGANASALRVVFPASVVVGMDVAATALLHTRRRGVSPLVRGSANELPFRDGVFDVVLIADVLNVAAVNDSTALREAHRVLRSGGVLAANVPAFEWLRGAHDVAVHTARRYRRAEVARLLVTAGFAVRRLTYWNALLLPVAWVVRRLRRTPASDLAAPLPRPINEGLAGVMVVEDWLARWLPVPFGTSVFAVASKRG
jgi:ubiquinone/menaquinone biosynthesis C-methylase UbiE